MKFSLAQILMGSGITSIALATVPNLSDSQIDLNYGDWSTWNKSNDPSASGLRADWTHSTSIWIQDGNGKTLWGSRPAFDNGEW